MDIMQIIRIIVTLAILGAAFLIATRVLTKVGAKVPV